MTTELEDKRKGPELGTAQRLVVFLHGYGADGADLLGLADPLAPHLDGTAFRAPDAPERSMANPMGYQWFPIPWLDGSTEAAADRSMQTSLALLEAYLARCLAEEGLTAKELLLVGFSQGTMMSLHHGLRRTDMLAGIVGFSGRLLKPEALESEITSKPPVILIHGDADDVVPFSSMSEAGQALTSVEVPTYAHVMKGTGHGIAPDGLSVALSFMREHFGISQ